MLNRRQVRKKVFQQLYAFQQHQNADNQNGNETLAQQDYLAQSDKKLQASFKDVFKLFLFQLDVLLKLKAKCAHLEDIEKKKFTPSSDQLNAFRLIREHAVLNLIEADERLQNSLENVHYNLEIEHVDLLNTLSLRLLETALKSEAQRLETSEENELLLHFFDQHLAHNNDVRLAYLENNLNWVDDVALVNTMSLKFLRTVEKTKKFVLPKALVDSNIIDFGRQLFIKTINRSAALEKAIADELTNWKVDRIALVDKLLIKMGLTEFYDFPDIPIRVTINEYIELSKDYSTPKSHVFVNGVLDKMQRKLIDHGKIMKPKA
ncbi:MAG: transcription antitermination factor NusB [Flavobacteriales bacterium]